MIVKTSPVNYVWYWEASRASEKKHLWNEAKQRARAPRFHWTEVKSETWQKRVIKTQLAKVYTFSTALIFQAGIIAGNSFFKVSIQILNVECDWRNPKKFWKSSLEKFRRGPTRRSSLMICYGCQCLNTVTRDVACEFFVFFKSLINFVLVNDQKKKKKQLGRFRGWELRGFAQQTLLFDVTRQDTL